MSYPSLAEARADGAIERGWLPAFLPASSRDIAEIHNLDTNERCARATADPRELSSLTHELTSFGYAPFEGALPPPPRFSRVRRCPFTEAETASVGAAFRRKATGTAEYEYLVLDWSTGTLFTYSALR